jgi:hypothetical protein
MWQLIVAGGTISIFVDVPKLRSRIGAGVPHWPVLIGFKISTLAMTGAKSRTQSCNALITSLSAHTSFAGSTPGGFDAGLADDAGPAGGLEASFVDCEGAGWTTAGCFPSSVELCGADLCGDVLLAVITSTGRERILWLGISWTPQLAVSNGWAG